MASISARTTHELWVEARLFTLAITRTSPSTLELTIVRPQTLSVTDGYVILVGTKPISGSNYPEDGTSYQASTDLAVPADRIESGSGAQVVAFHSGILGNPMPAGTIDPIKKTITTTLTLTNANSTQLYYASVHAATNVLQYYPIGVQSYPLEASRIEKDSSTYAGNIPSLASAPTDPTEGFVYHDQQLNLVQYWTGTTWIPTRADSILTGPQHPGIAGQTYLLNSSQLRVFDGSKWREATPSNLQFRVGSSWVPFTKVSALLQLPSSPAIGDLVWDYTTQRAQYWDGVAWIHPNSTNSLFTTTSGLIPAFVTPLVLEPVELPNPTIGQLFYNTTTQTLDAWTGVTWKQANTNQAGTPITDKIAIGTDGTYDERIRLINILKGQLGWPQNCLELTEEQFNFAIDNALDTYRQLSDGAYRMQYVMFPLIAGQQTYFLNSATDKTDRIVDVSKVHRLNILGFQTGSGMDAVWTSGILTSYYSGATVDILSLHMLASLGEEFQRLFAGDLTFLWNEASRELFFTRRVARNEKVIIECLMERTEQELLLDRWCKQFIQNYALAEAKMTLGLIRSRFSSGTPGAAGTITQNGELLVSEARQDMIELREELLNFEYGGHVGQGNVSFLFA